MASHDFHNLNHARQLVQSSRATAWNFSHNLKIVEFYLNMNTIAMLRNTMDILKIQPQVDILKANFYSSFAVSILQKIILGGGGEKNLFGGIYGVW